MSQVGVTITHMLQHFVHKKAFYEYHSYSQGSRTLKVVK